MWGRCFWAFLTAALLGTCGATFSGTPRATTPPLGGSGASNVYDTGGDFLPAPAHLSGFSAPPFAVPAALLILSISSQCLPPQVWAGCPQLPAALHLGERLGDSAWPSYHLLVSTKAAARLPVGPAAASSLPPPGFLQDRPGLCLHAVQWDLTSSFTWTRPYASSSL